jgi:hypothetical protein
MTIDKDHPNEVVKRQYETLMENGMPFLQIFPEMVQELTVAETFKNRAKERNKSLTQNQLDYKNASIEEFRENLFLYCGISLNIFNLSSQTQAAFWFMLFNWIECNNYSITIGPEKRKILAKYYSRSSDPNSRSVQNIFRALTKSGLLVKCNKKFIMMNNEIIQLRSELLERSRNYLLNKKGVTNNTTSEGVENAVDYVFNDVISKVSKRNIEALGKVNFSAKIDFSVEAGLKIVEIEHIENIESRLPLEYTNELTKIFNSIRLTKKQKELLQSNYLSLRETYFLQGETAFNLEFKNIAGLGRSTKKVLVEFFEYSKTEF